MVSLQAGMEVARQSMVVIIASVGVTVLTTDHVVCGLCGGKESSYDMQGLTYMYQDSLW